MIKLFLLAFSISLIVSNINAQQVPVYKGETYEDNGAMGPDRIETWNYKGYIFQTIEPGIARPIPFTIVSKKLSNGKLFRIENNELFNNTALITERVNSKLKEEFMTQKDNICYSDKVLKYTGLNELDIRVDENYMFF